MWSARTTAGPAQHATRSARIHHQAHHPRGRNAGGIEPTTTRHRSGSQRHAPDADASYTRKGGHTFYGYKAHVASDGAHQFIRAAVITTAKTYDGEVLPQITPADTRAVYADKAYDSKVNRAWLRTHGIRKGILKKEAHHIHLTPCDEAANRRKSQVRRHIERIFARLKHWQGYRRVRYLGLAKNQLELTLKAVAYNLKQLVKLIELQTT